jgi:hypothetical protein
MTRIRYRNRPGDVTGFAKRELAGTVIVNVNPSAWNVRVNKCTDEEHGAGHDNSLDIEHHDYYWIPMEGKWGPPGYVREYKNYYPNSVNGPLVPLATSLMDIDAAATAVLARTNPGRPILSVPTFVYELKDLPGMIKDIGQYKLKQLDKVRNHANWSLSYQMGWKPLISDLLKTLTFQEEVERRVDELQRLWSSKGLKRRLKLGSDSKAQDFPFVLESQLGVTFNAIWKNATTAKMWGTVRWKPTAVPSTPPGSKELNRYAFGLVTGVQGFRPEVLWDMMPWSWMIDWFGNVGDYLAATSNNVPCEHGLVNIMRQTNTQIYLTRTDNKDIVKGGEGYARYERKERFIRTGAVITASLPFLNGRQLSILGALALQRFKR